MRRLLYVSGTYAPGALAGSELSAHTLLRELARRGRAEARVLTDRRYTDGVAGRSLYEGVELIGVEHGGRLEALRAEIGSFRPDALLTQLIWSDVALTVGREMGVRTIFRIPSLPVGLDLAPGSRFAPTALLAPTEYAQREVSASCGRRPFVVRSAIDVARAIPPTEMLRPRFLTMFNPIDLKGGETFREIALRMPEREFAAVPGWHSLRGPDGSFDRELFVRAAESNARTYDGYLPSDIDLSGVANVTLLAPREAVHEIFAVTWALLVPSLWAEVTGRVAVEAFANGIPVVASAVGGLADHVGRAGIVVDDYREPLAWVDAIRRLDEPATYAECAERGRRLVAEEFSLERAVADFEALLDQIAGLGPGETLDAP